MMSMEWREYFGEDMYMYKFYVSGFIRVKLILTTCSD
jgi:hypothetical protein